jgi:hypothetical protein
VQTLADFDYPVSTDHGFTPHMTLKYQDDPIRDLPLIPADAQSTGPVWLFSHVWVCIGPEWTGYRLGGACGVRAIAGSHEAGSSRAGIDIHSVQPAQLGHTGVVADTGEPALAYRGFGSWNEARDAHRAGGWRSTGEFTVPGEGDTQVALNLRDMKRGAGYHEMRGSGFVGAIEADVSGLPYASFIRPESDDMHVRPDGTGKIKPDLGLGIGIRGPIPNDRIRRVFEFDDKGQVAKTWDWANRDRHLPEVKDNPDWDPPNRSDPLSQRTWVSWKSEGRGSRVFHHDPDQESQGDCGTQTDDQALVSYRQVAQGNIRTSMGSWFGTPFSRTTKDQKLTPCPKCFDTHGWPRMSKVAGPAGGRIPRAMRMLKVPLKMLREPRQVVLDRPAQEDLEDVPGNLKQRVMQVIDQVRQGAATLEAKGRELTGAFTARITNAWRAAFYMGIDTKWHCFWIGPHNYDEAERRFSQRFAKVAATEEYCRCCGGWGEHDTGQECYRCDGGDHVPEAEVADEPYPCDGLLGLDAGVPDEVGDPIRAAMARTARVQSSLRAAAFEFDYARNRKGMSWGGNGTYGSDVEPHGRYMIEKTPGSSFPPDTWETGHAVFENPLHLDFGGGYQEESNWKRQLSKRYDGKTGHDLSKAIIADGHDGIVTHDKYGTSEIVDLTGFRHRAATNYSGYKLTNRSELLHALVTQGVTPVHDKVDLHHVTHEYPSQAAAPEINHARVIGHAADEGVQALLVEVDGSTQRPDGGKYHITYSLAPGRKPRESNDLLAYAKIEPLNPPIPIQTEAF